jgi:hypothetical protein
MSFVVVVADRLHPAGLALLENESQIEVIPRVAGPLRHHGD